MLHLPAEVPPDVVAAAATIVARGREHLAAGAAKLLLDTAGGPHPGGTGQRAAAPLVAAVARELPVVLAGGLTPASVAEAARSAPVVGVDVASGVERPRTAGERPRKDPLKVALFVKRARAARLDRPNLAVRPTSVNDGLLEADDAGRWGTDRAFGGRYVPETLMAALRQLEDEYARFSATTRGSGPTCGSCSRGSPAARRRSTARTGSRTRPSSGRSPPTDRPDCRIGSASTSSAKTSPTPARTRSTTRSARPC